MLLGFAAFHSARQVILGDGYALINMASRSVVPFHQVAIRAQAQLLDRQPLYRDFDWLHLGAAFRTTEVDARVH
jgi:hypothetical protein